MKPLVSVILPVYNVEAYLERCIRSVQEQTYPNLEIILVDDGSTDRSSEMCDAFQKEDSRIIVVHKENGGLSDARNQGAAIATGEYITFIDSDDYVTPGYVEYLYYLIEKYSCEVSLCTHTVVFENGKKKIYGDGTDEVLSSRECLERMLYHDVIDTSAWAKLYRSELVKETPYPKGKLFEDIGTTYQFFLKSGKVACGYKSQYYYILRSNSIVQGSFNPQKFDMLEMTDQMARETLTVFPDLKQAVIRRRVYARFSTLNQLQDVPGYQEERTQMIAFIKQYRKEILQNSKAPRRDKLAIILLSISYSLYRMCWRLK